MPTNTLPFEVTVKLVNDGADVAMLQAATSRGNGATLRIPQSDSVSLLLDAGSTYSYNLIQGSKKVQIS